MCNIASSNALQFVFSQKSGEECEDKPENTVHMSKK
jgi:hypothetical protein